MAALKWCCILLIASLSLAICSAHKVPPPSPQESKTADEATDPNLVRNGHILHAGGGRGFGGGWGGALPGYGGGSGRGVGGSRGRGGGYFPPGLGIPNPSIRTDPYLCRPITCGNPNGCPGFTVYLSHPATAATVQKDIVDDAEEIET